MSISLNSFFTLLNTKGNKNNVEDFVKSHIKDEYVPYEKKADAARAIIDASYWITEKEKGQKGQKRLHIDSVAKHMLTCITMLDLYTDIERSKIDGKVLEDFNRLNGSGIFDIIIRNIDERELREFNMVVQMTADDLIANEYEPHAFFKNQIERFGNLIGTSLKPVLEGLDLSKIQEVISQIGE